ncbi:NUDIX hydrolase [Kitasatospora fiedleri]|uniref:NUDIX hydrolase n=1 Tax=Kitasatospora fiedleri TaxID=2991545 RepID=UPI00249B1DB4|nr:NUDIX hydrolase [Kitasatospora fiedleri]
MAGSADPVVPVRVCVVLLNRGELCLIRRRRAEGEQYSLPGGLLDPGEGVAAGLARELGEELGPDIAGLSAAPRLRWVQEQETSRPGGGGLFRRRHLVHVLGVSDRVRALVAATERDAEDANQVVWVPLAEAAGLHLYPAVGPVLAGPLPRGDAPPVRLPRMDDLSYRWR